MIHITLFAGSYTSLVVVWDFFHQQYVCHPSCWYHTWQKKTTTKNPRCFQQRHPKGASPHAMKLTIKPSVWENMFGTFSKHRMQIQVILLGWPPSKNDGHQDDFTCFRIGDPELNLHLSHFFLGMGIIQWMSHYWRNFNTSHMTSKNPKRFGGFRISKIPTQMTWYSLVNNHFL